MQLPYNRFAICLIIALPIAVTFALISEVRTRQYLAQSQELVQEADKSVIASLQMRLDHEAKARKDAEKRLARWEAMYPKQAIVFDLNDLAEATPTTTGGVQRLGSPIAEAK